MKTLVVGQLPIDVLKTVCLQDVIVQDIGFLIDESESLRLSKLSSALSDPVPCSFVNSMITQQEKISNKRLCCLLEIVKSWASNSRNRIVSWISGRPITEALSGHYSAKTKVIDGATSEHLCCHTDVHVTHLRHIEHNQSVYSVRCK